MGWEKEAQGGGSKQRGQQYKKLTAGLVGDTGWSWVILVDACLSLDRVPGCDFV